MPPKGWRKHKDGAARDTNPAPGPGRVEATAPAPKQCSRCMYWLNERAKIGDCYRYPRVIPKRDDHFCGEFTPRREEA